MTTPAPDSIGAIGEFGLIEAIRSRFTQARGVLLESGDDAAVVAAADGRVVVTTDVLVEGRHFRRDWSSAADVGHKAAAQSLADIAAMGARPTAIVVGLAAPPELPLAWAVGLADGLQEECAAVKASVVGGDVVRSDQVVVSVTALGDLAGVDPVTRSGARPGDVLAVCGRLGWAAAGMAVLQRGFRSPRVLVDAHRRPQPPYAQGVKAAAAGAHAMCDVSDGLVADLGHIASASEVCPGNRLPPRWMSPSRWLRRSCAWGRADERGCSPAVRTTPWTARSNRAIGGARVAGDRYAWADGSGVLVDGEPWPGSERPRPLV